ncbi:MAG: hypothetical protein KDC66_14885 [Phaeodactylibacter sp.]|nr:hypothetical protein [Phaeodactylibacter sp.]MCB9273775.1 hypothetical protein [Lewinellaceae bacterium]
MKKHPDASASKAAAGASPRAVKCLPGSRPFQKLSLLSVAVHVKQAGSMFPLLALVILVLVAILYFFLAKPILDMDFDISPDNQELVQIYEELWD